MFTVDDHIDDEDLHEGRNRSLECAVHGPNLAAKQLLNSSITSKQVASFCAATLDVSLKPEESSPRCGDETS